MYTSIISITSISTAKSSILNVISLIVIKTNGAIFDTLYQLYSVEYRYLIYIKYIINIII